MNDVALAEDREQYDKLIGILVPLQWELLVEQSLYDIGISPTSHLGSFFSVDLCSLPFSSHRLTCFCCCYLASMKVSVATL